MTIRTTPANLLHTPAIPVQARLAAAWTSFMFLYIYVDILNFYKPGVVDGILNGLVWRFAVNSTLLTVPTILRGSPPWTSRFEVTTGPQPPPPAASRKPPTTASG